MIEALAHLTRALAQIETLPATPVLRREQIKLQVAILTPLMHLKGQAAPETKAAVQRARQLIEQADAFGEPSEDSLLLFSVLYGFYVANFTAFNRDGLRELATQFLDLAKKQETTIPLMIDHRLMGILLVHTGDIARGCTHLDRALMLYDPAEHRPLAMRFGQDTRVTVLSHRSLALWMLGYPDAAMTDVDCALKDAREIGQAATLMHALGWITHTLIFCGNYAAANALLGELAALADEKGAALWKPISMMYQGCLLVLTGKATAAVQTITSGLTAWQSTGATVFPDVLLHLARAFEELGQFDDAWRCIGEAMLSQETSFEAEVHRVAGERAAT